MIPEQYQNNGLLCRWMVLEMLGKILVEKKMISDLKENQSFPFKSMMPEHKARSLSLLDSVLRNMNTLDSIINLYLTQKTSIRVMNILRIAAAEMLIDKIATHAAVDSAVRLTKLDKKLMRFSGLTNAICRKISKTHIDKLELGVASLNEDFILSLSQSYNLKTIEKFGLAQAKRPPLDITLKDESRSVHYANLLEGVVLPSGSVRLVHQKQVTKLLGYELGDWWVQDFSASIPVRLLGNIDGLSVLDVCAAPGGKTMQLISKGAHVTALEISKKRAIALNNNLGRTGLKAEIITEDVCKFKTEKYFDVVLVDAPCSATGTIRRNCDLQFLEPLKRISFLVKQQIEILRASMKFVKPGGRLVYCTCSLMPEEGENVIIKLLQESANWKQLFIQADKFGVDPEWLDNFGGLRLQPNYWQSKGGMDGFYIATLIKEK